MCSAGPVEPWYTVYCLSVLADQASPGTALLAVGKVLWASISPLRALSVPPWLFTREVRLAFHRSMNSEVG